MSVYRIERCEVYPNKLRSSIIGKDFTSLNECNQKIKDYAESWRKEASGIQHHAGQSVVFFKGYYVEFTRLPSTPAILVT
jgi:hypothetical protein